MSTASLHQTTVVVVDRNPADYDALLGAADEPRMNLHFLVKGNDALRLARKWAVDLWVINATLADMSGFDLAQMLRRSHLGARVFIVDDEYRVENELQTLSLGLSMYVCKPVEPAWICATAQPRVVPAPEPAAAAAGDEAPVILPMFLQPHRRPAA
jgi:DNA-binding response OmpR family regulator